MAHILLIDDDPGVLFTLEEILISRGHQVTSHRSGREALAQLEGVEAVVVDLQMPEMDGLAVLRLVRERDESLPVIMLTAHGSERVAVEAMRNGASDYLPKPFDVQELMRVLERALELHALRRERRNLLAERALGRRIIGEAPAMRRLLETVARVAARDVTVLVRGETGTGKELIASLLHAQSRRADKPLVRFNCAAIPGELAEAELFGHARGAFTGAQAARRGYFAQADGGTLVLDEVGELPLAIQAKLLRALQEGEIQPVGAGRIEHVDVRIIASTHQELRAAVKAGTFREDLYYRLAVVELGVPALRERREDIPALAADFARRYAEKFDVPRVELTPALVERLCAAPWPGNVRELENAIAQMVATSLGGPLGPEALRTEAGSGPELPGEPVPPAGRAPLKAQVEAFERGLIARAMAEARGNQSEASRLLGTSRQTLIDKIRKYGLDGSR
jgi:two-component system response regulator AtoC